MGYTFMNGPFTDVKGKIHFSALEICGVSTFSMIMSLIYYLNYLCSEKTERNDEGDHGPHLPDGVPGPGHQ